MAVAVSPPTLNEQQYRAVIDQLKSAGSWPPAGLVHHSCFGEADNLMIYEVWETQEALDTFGQKLMPLLQQQGIDSGQPHVMPVVNLVP